ncbi:MAG: hypothetical protein NC548_22680 [Lachnospiraceae bacterium]|nr:hypothetical protein [Lachnospiraceae bacterium]
MITILNETEKITHTFGWSPLALFFIFIFMTITGMCLKNVIGESLYSILAGLCTIFLVLSFIREERYTVYEVIINENVSMIEFYDKYDVISAKGQIYTVRDKER